jgi:Uma2 family endonuclease
MTTLLKLGPEDHGKPVAYDDFASAAWEDGFQYELIDGKLYVAALPDLPQDFVDSWLYGRLFLYKELHPEVIRYVTRKARVFVPDRPGVTNPEPDVAAYRYLPAGVPLNELGWRQVSPFLVAEVLSADDPNKDLVRNVELYLQVPSIREYWIVDTRPSVLQPTMYVYRRRGERWQRRIEVQAGETYATRLLPGFRLLLSPTF